MAKYWKVILSAGFCGTDATKYIKCEEEDLEKEFVNMVADHAGQYSYLAHLRSVEDVIEDGEADNEEEAQEIVDQEYDDFIYQANEHSSYEECSDEEWKEHSGEEW